MSILISFLAAAVVAAIYSLIVQPLYISPLSQIPGPKLFALTKWRLALEDWSGRRTSKIHSLHQQYGPIVRIGPKEIHFNSLSALRTIYGPGSSFGRTAFYRMFDVYGKQNLFTFHSVKEHGERKRLVANAYSKSNVTRGPVADLVSVKIQEYLRMVEECDGHADDIFTSLHYYSLDSITNFLYGSERGGTSAMKGDASHRALLIDILDPARKRLTWFAAHFPVLTTWLYSRMGLLGRLVTPLLPMKRPTTYTGIRSHALKAMEDYKAAQAAGKLDVSSENSIIGRLYNSASAGNVNLSDVEIASECADHFLAGIDTTSDTIMFVIWALSLPQNVQYQQKLINEARAIPDSALDSHGAPTLEAADKLPYFDAVIKETLRLYAPIPGSEPRSSNKHAIIDGFHIPSGTIVCMAPYSLHRNPEVFPNPEEWNPERWLCDPEQLATMKRWYWPFSSGGRMCIGMHLALAEMALVPTVYRKYRTRVKLGMETVAPGITSRFEIFGDERFERTQEHTCWVNFVEQ